MTHVRSLIAARSLAVALALAGSFSVAAKADTITWMLEDVTFDDGGTASGTFTVDATTGQPLSVDIVTTDGSTLQGTSYSTVAGLPSGLSWGSFLTARDLIHHPPTGNLQFINITFANPLTTPGIDPILPELPGVAFSAECINCFPSRLITGGEAVSVAVPGPIAGAGLPGFAAVCAGLFGWWRRKRRAEAAA
jgi:hypothetical protein